MQRLVFAVVLLSGCVRELDKLPEVDEPAPPQIPVIASDRLVVSAGRDGYTARVLDPKDGERYVWTAVNGYIAPDQTRGPTTMFKPAGIGVMVLVVEAQNDSTQTEQGSLTFDVVAPPPEDLVLDAPHYVTEYRQRVDVSVSTKSAVPLTYEWEIESNGVITPIDSSGATSFVDFFEPGVVTLRVRVKNGAGDASLLPAERVIGVVAKSTTLLAGGPGGNGDADGSGGAARFLAPAFIVADHGGGAYVLDRDALKLRHVSPEGLSTSLGGRRDVPPIYRAPADPAIPLADVRFREVFGMVRRSETEIAIFERTDNLDDDTVCQIRIIDEPSLMIRTLNEFECDCDTASFSEDATAITSDGAGSLYVADEGAVLHIDEAGAVSLYAGACDDAVYDDQFDGPRLDARFYEISAMSFIDGALEVLEANSYLEYMAIRTVPATGDTTTRYLSVTAATCAGDGYAFGLAPCAAGIGDPYVLGDSIYDPKKLLAGAAGERLIVSRAFIARQPAGDASPVFLAGTPSDDDEEDTVDGVGEAIRVQDLHEAVETTDGAIWLVVPQYGVVRRVIGALTGTPQSIVADTVAGRAQYFVPASEEGGVELATASHLLAPSGVALLGEDIFLIDWHPGGSEFRYAVNRLRATETGVYTTQRLFGNLDASTDHLVSDGAHLGLARFRGLSTFEPDGDGFLIVENGELYSIGEYGYAVPLGDFDDVTSAVRLPDGGIAVIANDGTSLRVLLQERFDFPIFEDGFSDAFTGLAHDNARPLYYSSGATRAIHAIDLATNEKSVVAGVIDELPEPYNINDGVPCAEARFKFPRAMRYSPAGELFVIDDQAIQRIRLSPVCVVDTITAKSTERGLDLGSPARLNHASGLVLTRARDLLVTDGAENSLLLLRY